MSSRCNLWIALLLLASCATAPPARTTRTEPTYRTRPGVIESVEKIEEQRVASNAGNSVILGLIVGGLLFSGLLFQRGTGSVVGAEGGTSSIAAPDGTTSTLPRYQVVVRFDDGDSMTLVYTNDVAFHRGERVMLTQQGLVGAESTRSAQQVPANRAAAMTTP